MKEPFSSDARGETFKLGHGMWLRKSFVTDSSCLYVEVTDEQLGLFCGKGAYGYYMPDGTPCIQVETRAD